MLHQFLLENREAVLKRWRDLILETYPADSNRFLKAEKDQFNNPVGFSITQGIGNIYDELLNGFNLEKIHPSLDYIIRIRSVQDFSPSQAVGFIFLLKETVGEELKRGGCDGYKADDLNAFFSKLDKLAMYAFDIYMNCREKLYDLRINDMKRRSSRLFERMNLDTDESE
ncbi:MAG: hypothetical protein GY855_16105 [candidate division Zixibacteria bacterium]|nr:hypothetical protein [candidate division Zixibacteria bacterium]